MLNSRRVSGKSQRRFLGHFRPLFVLAIAALFSSVILAVTAQTTDIKNQVDPEAAVAYHRLSDGVSPLRIQQTIAKLSSITYTIHGDDHEPDIIANSRIAGTPGGDQARQYVFDQFNSIFGAANVHKEDFNVTLPVDHGASVTSAGHTYSLRPLWPNLVRTSTLPKNGVDGPLIYGGNGDIRAFRGKQVQGSIVLLDFNCGTHWLNAPRLGAKAVIFVEPTRTMRGEAEAKFIGIPVAIPRFYIDKGDAASLEAQALTVPNATVHVTSFNPWENHTSSNIVGIIPGSDPVLSKQIMVVESYFDSMSVVPTLAPGAESTCGIASLMELARQFRANPPKRTIWFVASGAHFLGLQGARTFVDKHIEEWQPVSGWDRFKHWISGGRIPLPSGRSEVMLFSGLDLSSQTSSIGVFYKGDFYDFREDVQGDFADIGRTLRENAAKIGQVLGFDPDARFADGINSINGKNWRNYLPGQFAFDAETATMAGGKGITFCNTDDSRQRVDTPEDTPDQVNVANVVSQTKLLACEYWHFFNDTNDPDAVSSTSTKGLMPISDWPAWTRQGLRLGFSKVTGRVLEWDPLVNFVPDRPIVNSLAVVGNPEKTMTGVRGNLIQGTDGVTSTGAPDSQFSFVGLPLVISNGTGLRFPPSNNMHFMAYHLKSNDTADGNRGDIDYAPDEESDYKTEFDLTGDTKESQIVVFKCLPTSIYDLVDQSALTSLTGVKILDGATDSHPREYGFSLAGNEPGVSYVEDVAVLFSMPGKNSRIKVLMDSGVGTTRFLLINSLPPLPNLSNSENQKRAEGSGYAVGSLSARSANYDKEPDPNNPDDVVRNGAITLTALRVAEDMWNLDEFRIKQLEKFRIINENLHNARGDGLHDVAAKYIALAKTALAKKDYDAFDAYSRQGWAYESRVYPEAQNTANDVIKGVVFYLFLLIPFAYFLERLFVSAPVLKLQMLWVLGIFLGIFGIFSQIHPAFQITVNPLIILIAFVMLALSVFVSTLVWGKFEEQMKAFGKTVTGVHKTDVKRSSIAFAAFALGISNMRRRKERTLLTSVTLILLTFIVLSFTSVIPQIRLNDVAAPGVPNYNGILLRMPTWDPLQDPAYRLLNDQYGRDYAVAPRAWFYGTTQGQQTFLRVTRAEFGTDVKGVTGLSPEESRVTPVTSTLIAGRWFNASDAYSVIIPKGIADSLGITAADVSKVSVNFTGVPYLVIGIVDPDKFKAIKDLDNETLTPVDFLAQNAQSASSTNASSAQQGFQEYQHLDPNNVIIVPYRTLINSGGSLRSVAINFNDSKTTNLQLKKLIKTLDLNIYAGINGANHRFSAIGATKSEGLVNIIIPMLIAALIVLNTMLGSVFERVKEIGIFSSIGLSPNNIAMLFIAEAVVYAIIGAVSGYLIGQTLAKIISTFNILPGLILNFSSISAEMSIGLVVAVVLLSTIFPARKASEVATPAVDRTWKLPDPDGDAWTITLPFAVTGSQAVGVNGFIAEWFSSYEEQSVGDFLTQGIGTQVVPMELGLGHRLTGRIWLAPFDLGVSQDIQLDTIPTDLEDVFSVTLTIFRVSGDVSNWKRINRRFVNVLRQQFLIWRTLSSAERERYVAIQEDQDSVSQTDSTTVIEASPVGA